MSSPSSPPSVVQALLAQSSSIANALLQRYGPAAPGKLEWLKNLLFYYVLLKAVRHLYTRIACQGPLIYARNLYKANLQSFFKLAKRIPYVQRKVQAELKHTIDGLNADIAPVIPGLPPHRALPDLSRSDEDIRSELEKLHGLGKVDWKSGKVSGAIYHGGEHLSKLTSDAYALFSLANPLHPEVFPGVRKMEAECVAMVLSMYHAPVEAGGCVTSGGTESILMACKAYRDLAKEEKGITQPEMIIPTTAHAAFDKAAGYFGIRIIWIDVDPATMAVPVKKVAQAVNRNTILIVGSAPGFPHGIIDDIEGLNHIALRHNIPLHVDACLGGFLIPFMEDAGYKIPPFDFRLPGVTSISCDTHKYGFAPKGSSTILYRSRATRHYQYSVMTEWVGGVYASPGVAGSRPGALVAGCWTALMSMGREGYVQSTQRIVRCARRIGDIVRETEGVNIVGNPLVSVIAFTSAPPLSLYTIGDGLRKRGWNLNTLQFPVAIHIACTNLTVGHEEEFARDLADSIAEARILKDDGGKEADDGLAAIYGVAATLPDRGIIADVARGFIDALYHI